MSDVDKLLNEVVKSQVEAFTEDDAYYQFMATPIKPASSIKAQHQRQLSVFFQLTSLRSELDQAVKLILAGLPNLITSEQFALVEKEINGSSDHFIAYMEKTKNEIQSDKVVVFSEMFGVSDDSLLHIYDLGVALIENDEITDGAFIFRFLTTLSPHVPSYWLALGICFQMLSRFEEALIAFSSAKFLSPMDPVPSFHLVQCYRALKEESNEEIELGVLENILSKLNSEEREVWRQKIS